jgi:hypothetical protein
MSMTFGETLTREPAAYGGFADAIGGVATIVLAILGLSGLFPDILAGIATIVFGVALLIQGGTMLSEYAGIIFPRGETWSGGYFGGNTLAAVFLVGAAGIVLGILALIRIHPEVLIPVAIIAFGTALVLASNAVWHLYVAKRASMAGGTQTAGSGSEILASEMASGSAGMQALAGLAAVVLGILAIAMAGADITLFLVAFLVLGATLMLTGSTLSGAVLSLMPQQRPWSEEPRPSAEPPRPYGQTHPTQGE